MSAVVMRAHFPFPTTAIWWSLRISSKRSSETSKRIAASAGGTIAAKYRNPKDPSQTWAGRGRQPLWLVDALKKGQKIENFLV